MKKRYVGEFEIKEEEDFQGWLKSKSKYLTEETVTTIESDWREAHLEEQILKILFELWSQMKLEGDSWKPQIARKAVNSATNGAWCDCSRFNREMSVCLQKRLTTIKGYYLTWSKK